MNPFGWPAPTDRKSGFWHCRVLTLSATSSRWSALAGGSFVPEAGIQRAELEFDKFSVGDR